jgi:ribosomal protein S18 acetylase RimI-like enzyme
VRRLVPDDLDWAAETLGGGLSGRLQARRGELIDVLADDGLVAERGGHLVGLLTHRPDGPGRIEISGLLAVEPGAGVGSALVRALVAIARDAGAGEIRVTTTNDNLTALGFYQRRGFRLVELRAGAVDESRRTFKPSIPETGADGLPLRDELELGLDL